MLLRGIKRVLGILGVVVFCFPAIALSEQAEKAKKEGISPLDIAGKVVEGIVSPIFKLGEVIVTATKREITVAEAPGNISVITAGDIKEAKVENLDEAIGYLAGCYNQRAKGLMDSYTTVALRGFSGQEKTLVMLNGQPLNIGYTGSVEWTSIPVEHIERIEVVRGPSSALYGGNAMGGVINIIMKEPQKREIAARSSYGTHGSEIYDFSYGDRLWDRFSLSLGFDRKETNGYVTSFVTKSSSANTGTPSSGWTKTLNTTAGEVYLVGEKGRNWAASESFNGRVSFNLSPDSKISLATVLRTHKYGYDDGSTYLRDSAGNPVESGYAYVENGTRKLSKIYPSNFLGGPGERVTDVYTAQYDTRLNEKVNLKISCGITDQGESWYITPDSTLATAAGGAGVISSQPSERRQFEIQSDINLVDSHILTLGLNLGTAKAENKELNLSNWKNPASITTQSKRTRGKDKVIAFYLQDEISLLDNLNIFGGARVDYWETYDGINETTEETTTYSSRDKTCFSPKVALVYNPWEITTLRASFGKAFRPPTVYELYKTLITSSGKTYNSNPNLSPETAWSWETGLEQRLGQSTIFKITYFENDIEDLIFNATDPDNSTITTKENAGKGKTDGVEFELTQRLASFLDFFGNYTYTDARIIENSANPAAVDKQVTYVPMEMYNLGFNFHKGAIKANIIGHYVGQTFAEDDNTDTTEGVYGSHDSYFTVDGRCSYTFKSCLEFSFLVDNIFDEEYYIYYKAPGRTFMGEVLLRF